MFDTVKDVFWEGSVGKVNGFGTVGLISLIIFMITFAYPALDNERDTQLDMISKMSCGELKDRIAYRDWDGFHESWAEIDGPHHYEWRCEK